MTWPRRIYAATLSAGVFYAENFVDPSTQPVWTTVNNGLAALDCREFALDPFDPAGRQYVLLEASRTLYRRENGGAWASILTSAQIATVVGQAATAVSFCVDAATDGRLWVLVKADGFWEPVWCLSSTDCGDTWSATVVRSGWYTYGAHYIRGYGDDVFASCAASGGAPLMVAYSANGGATWSEVYYGDLESGNPITHNPLLPKQIYTQSSAVNNTDLQQITSAGVMSILQASIGPGRLDGMWFDPFDADHQRVLSGAKLYVTTDAWANINSPSTISPTPVSFAPWAGADTDQMLVGLALGTHVIGALSGEDDTTAAGIAGANAGTAPYADSIPATCGGLAIGGIQAVNSPGVVRTYSVAMPGYVGTDRGTPMPGDRSAWDMSYGTVHASDIAAGALTRHLPAPAAAGSYARDNGTVWVSQTGIPITDLSSYVRGSIIRGGAATWETLDAKGARKVLIGDGTDLVSRVLEAADLPAGSYGNGTAGRVAQWAAGGVTLENSTLSKTGAGVLTLDAAGGYTLTVPATGTAALLGTANVFTAAQTVNVNSATALLVEQDGVHDDVLVVDTTNGRVGINTAAPAAALDITGDVRVSGTEVTVADKNKHKVYLSDGANALFRRQTYYWNGSAWAVDYGYGFGIGALQDNTGERANGVGANALRYNTGGNANGFGYAALQNNTGERANGVGATALRYNTGGNANGFGYAALLNNTGTYANGFGYAALQNNAGAGANGFGYAALLNNAGAGANGFGYVALYSNTGGNANGFGYAALQNNTGERANGVGANALRYNQAVNAIAIGYNAWASFLANAAGAKTFDYTAIDATTDRITVTAHGFGATGDYINLLYTQGTSAITGLTTATIYQVKIVDANTIGFREADGPGGAARGTDITAAGTGTGHTLTPQYTYTGSIVIGHDTDPTKAYQVTLGSSDIVETLLRGVVLVNTTTVGAQLAVDQSSATGAIPVLLLDQGDLSEEFIRFVGQSAADASQSLVDVADMATPGALAGWIKVYIQDDASSGAIADGAYYVPFYAAPTA